MNYLQPNNGHRNDAKSYYEDALLKNPNDFDALHSLGMIAYEGKNLILAIELICKSISINPNIPITHLNCGVVFQDLKKLEEALQCFDQAISLDSNYVEAYFNRANVLWQLERFDCSIASYEKAINIKSDSADIYTNYANALLLSGKPEKALESYIKAITLNPNHKQALFNFAQLLTKVCFNGPQPYPLIASIERLLDGNDLIRPVDIAAPIISLLKTDENFNLTIKSRPLDWLGQSLTDLILNLSKSSLLLKLMSICPIPDIEIENFLNNIRSSILQYILRNADLPEILYFQEALALHCFTNEYIYSITEDEDSALVRLEAEVERSFSLGKQPSPNYILCLASYKSLNKYKWSALVKLPKSCDKLVKRQIIHYLIEDSLKNQIQTLEKITDPTSCVVRNQYEDNPYPRWENVCADLTPRSVAEIISSLNLRLIDTSINSTTRPTILVAGCGTGQHPIETALRYQDSQVIAVDLSINSLAYAKRKTQERGIKNIKYLQADILDLHKLNKQFDIVECSGVLHHMNNPIEGLKVLLSCLKNGGLMKIGLYSQLARDAIVKIRNEAIHLGISSSEHEMRSFRNKIINSSQDHHKWVQLFTDFYSLSSFRDLLCHVQEHRFTLLEIEKCLSSLNLTFCGFENKQSIENFMKIYPKPLDLYDLKKWNDFEIMHPLSFIGMYQFVCQKHQD